MLLSSAFGFLVDVGLPWSAALLEFDLDAARAGLRPEASALLGWRVRPGARATAAAAVTIRGVGEFQELQFVRSEH
jgi:hypothetical protein